MQLTSEHRVAFVGAGAMSEAIIKGLLAAQILPPSNISVSNRNHSARLRDLQERYGILPNTEMKLEDYRHADLLILATKPFDVVQALQEFAAHLSPRQLIISVAAGVSTATLERCLPAQIPVIRAMPNTSSFVQASATAICAGRWATDTQIEMAQRFFSAIGITVQVPEEQMDAVTGLSGTGPAYFYYVVEALLAAGQACGLSEETSRTLLLQTLYGSARMLEETGLSPAQLRKQVTSPNGTTMAGISVLEQADGQSLFLEAVRAATRRATEMGRALE